MKRLLASALIGFGLIGASPVFTQGRQEKQDKAHADKPADASVSAAHLDAFYKALPDLPHITLDESLALTLTSMPLACIDHPQVRPSGAGYLWEATYRPPDDYQRTRVFYGCYDWHSAANSMWSLVKSLKLFPNKPTAALIRSRLDKHFGASNVAGEVEFFKQSGTFEVPYGLSWTLKLQGELLSWDDPDAKRWAANLQPLVTLFSQRLTTYFTQLQQPVRTGVHPNSALGMNLMWDYLDIAKDQALKTAISDAAKRFYTNDKDCKVADEPGPTDFISPCMSEAAIMGKLMDRAAFVTWFDTFMPRFDSPQFAPLTKSIDPSEITNPARLAAKSHMIGLAFMRAEEMNRVAAALPSTDPRATALRRLSAVNAKQGMSAMYVAGYLGSHFLGAFSLLYLISV
jgi:hypothetical protein